MQALILAGGEGTRLRPLTSTIPKPVVPLAGRPFIVYMLEWLRAHGTDEVILACGFMADGVRAVLGDGSDVGLRLIYVEEPRPLGTGGALKFAQGLLAERFLMLNGDVLTDIDLGAQIRQHETTGARATLGLVEVVDPSAYGLVRLNDDRTVRAFVEKPGQQAGSQRSAGGNGDGANLISAGVYVLNRDILEHVPPAGTASSIERDVFPRLVGQGLYGHPASGYWLDIGTPERYLKGTFDLLDRTGGAIGATAGDVQGAVAPVLVHCGAKVAGGAIVGPYTVLGAGVTIGEGARIERSVLLEGASVGAGSIITHAIIGRRAQIGHRCHVQRDVVMGERAVVESGSTVAAGARIFPGMVVGEGALSS